MCWIVGVNHCHHTYHYCQPCHDIYNIVRAVQVQVNHRNLLTSPRRTTQLCAICCKSLFVKSTHHCIWFEIKMCKVMVNAYQHMLGCVHDSLSWPWSSDEIHFQEVISSNHVGLQWYTYRWQVTTADSSLSSPFSLLWVLLCLMWCG